MYKCFIDDSGGKNYKNKYDSSLKECLPDWPNHRKWLNDNFFVLCGIHIKIADIKIIDEEIKALKRTFFGTHHVEIKSVFLRNPKLSTENYLDPYNLSKKELKSFGDTLYELLDKYSDKYQIFATIFDKRQYKYRERPDANCLLKSTQVIMERIFYSELETVLVFDQMESSLSKEKGQHREMLRVHSGNGRMQQTYIDEYKNIIDVEFQKSDKENMLQIADLFAYNIRRQFMQYGRCMIDGNCSINSIGSMECGEYEYFSSMKEQFYSIEGKVIGKGLVVIPNFKKINWNFN